jgi:hypothetical protein
MRFAATIAVGASMSGCSLYFAQPNPDGSASGVDYAAACAAPEGPGIVMDSSQVPTNLAGRWWKCGGADEFQAHPVELTIDLHYYLLTEVSGAFARNLGPDTSGTYSVRPSSASFDFAIDVVWTDGSTIGYPLMGYIEHDPRKMRLGGGSYVAIP